MHFGDFFYIMDQDPSPATQTPRGDHRSENRKMDFPVTGPELASSVWDWNDLLELTSDDHLPISFDDYGFSPPPLEALAGDPNTVPAPDRVRKRDPRMTCSNFIAGRVPCACPEIDAQVEKLEEEEAGAPGKKRARTGRVGSGTCRCQVPGCEVDISELKGYHRRHRICLRCANSSTVLIDGETKRYCQQCGKFHLLSNFDEGKRSCRRKLERHNIRRRRKIVGSKTAVNKESQGAIQSDGIACDGEAGKDDLSGLIAEEEPAFESEEALVSAHCSAPLLQDIRNDSVITLIDTETDGGKDDSKFSNSTSYCDSKTAYSSMAGSLSSFMIGIQQNSHEDFGTKYFKQFFLTIFEWLANMPVELEGYIRPGCTILTVFISMPNNMWAKLSENPMTYMHDFVFRPGRMLYGRGFMTIYLNNMIFRTRKDGTSMVKIDAEVQVPRLHFVYPACFEAGKPMEFVACGSNLLQPKFRFLVSFAGRYLPCYYRVASSLVQSKDDSPSCDHQLYKIYIPQTEPDLFGPAFIEVENQSGLSNFIPVLIGDKEVCSEMKSIQQRFDASVFQERSIFSTTGSLVEACEMSTSQHRAYSEFLLDIAWLLREPKLENFKETMASSQILRFNRLLSFLIQNESTIILKKILQNLKIVVEMIGFDGTNDSGVRLLQKYMNHARDILSDELQKGEIPVFRSEYIEQERNQVSQSSFDNNELPIVPKISQVLEERTSKLQTIMAAPTPSETVPLLNKEIIMNVNLSKDYSRKSCGFATMRLRSRPTVLIIAATAICLGMCAVIFHPNRVGEFAVTMRRCLFDRV
ncbi:squamosa promoter-binding-like protein 7 isoform X1 [Gossypium raimondii]|uniref:squamosa promoter-binding-like protein 7 isoform X1 n=1 Tax=Gossypium raimondii TaxID=29730 RepID=UPI00227B8394|nr:squamosa promoter-binding-like protein 7 isoform X1 [Gossypium raimondii]